MLVSANLTNLVLSGAFSLSFLSYAAHVVLPFLAAAVCTYPVLLLLFRSRTLVPARIETGLTHAEVHAALIDKRGAIFGSALLVVTLGVLVGVSTIGVPVWEVTVPPAVIMLLRDSYHDWTRRNVGEVDEDATECGEDCICWAKEKNCTADADVASPPTMQVGASKPRAAALDDDATECGEDCICWTEEKNPTADAGVDLPAPEVAGQRRVGAFTTPDADPAQCGEGCICTTEQEGRNPNPHSGHPSAPLKVEAHIAVEPTRNEQTLPTVASPSTPDAAVPMSAHVSLSSKASGPQQHLNLITIVSAALAWSTKSFPTVTHIAARLPVALLPFSFLMFILVQGLLTQGWVEVFAHWWSVWVSQTGTLGAVGGMGFLSCMLCNVSLSLSIHPPSRFLSLISHAYTTVLWDEHRRHDPPRARPPALGLFRARRPACARRRDLRAGHRLELWRVHAHVLRVARGPPVAPDSPPEGHPCPAAGFLAAQPPDLVCVHVGGVRGARWAGVCRASGEVMMSMVL